MFKDKRAKINIEDYTIDSVDNGEIVRIPNSISGQQFIIKNCNSSKIFLLDHMNTVTIDDCTNCRIVLGPVKGSVFLRDCKDCVCVIASGQFRSRDCRKMNIFLCCATQPIIEASTSMHFGCYQLAYKDLEDHFHLAGLSIFNNNWSNIHDFTPVEGEHNWSILPNTTSVGDYVPLPCGDDFKCLNLCLSGAESVVPYTWGPSTSNMRELCLVSFFYDSQQKHLVKAFINTIEKNSIDCLLLQTKEVKLQVGDAELVFASDALNSMAHRGPVVGLHFNGPYCIKTCEGVAQDIAHMTGRTDLVYVSPNPAAARQQVQSFFNFATMQMHG